MGKWLKRAQKKGRVDHSREVEAILDHHGRKWREGKGSHRHCGRDTWYEGELSPGVSRNLTKSLKAQGLLAVIFVTALAITYLQFA